MAFSPNFNFLLLTGDENDKGERLTDNESVSFALERS